MKMPTLPTIALPTLLGGTLIAALCLLAGCEGDTAGAPGRGAPCDFQEDCAQPTVCAKTAEYEWTICTGTVKEGGACTTANECRFERRDGLPLDCISGTCRFTVSDSDASEEPNG
jgi:hypothetical protein